MKRLIIFFYLTILLLTMQGCVYFNDEGVGIRLYRDCKEYYDVEGIYHRECDKNLVDYHDVTGD